ncbi:hypothetical protein A2757_00985 [Candidatus Giovannonibacteria bacterium RIFCSPHIGHO2_01_FULL_48_47]|nr:MAG: hypothetical protein A2757_00985 [Candidatus Giovannonibacteria bacterium RIFCSPHIGHO2_01_FULL_48_47]OGF67775.1 MAG: hypothetical protein A3D61_02845 [Candidatus Giovannonibacteria bacterium RIFCSPHIGHO2_02_FULL_48_15]OGF88425.1 MAG: hypothetical protein A3B26_01745 [Candidatus Giovannonibacteria bacterium RIFCSPLOWO2_01_FULL_48_47]OGF94708.1 MAG: hypothetical protein A2433_03595 [Candidatus Giovannonibacteria bacterium RIFOXYC1_FULL_48_8]OGF96258.1 MAG: hypothetical protein A2613_01665
MEKEIGKVIHYYDKLGVAVVRLSGSLATGDAIKIKKGESEFTDIVESMQVEHAPVMSAQAGQEVAIKISQKTKEGASVSKVEE